jgi:hypothetical protein
MRKGRRYYGSAFLFLEGFIFPKTYFRKLLSLSEKSKWQNPEISTPIKVNYLRTGGNGKIAKFWVFRQARYISICFPIIEKVSI